MAQWETERRNQREDSKPQSDPFLLLDHTHTCELRNYNKHTHTNAYKLMKYEYTHTNISGELQIRIHTYKQIR